ncbi:tetratricopeptide repeat protein [Roseicella aquatilis]|uniref:Tetratricopeptide repeat protein n=1 Tax=Roseicella aquatilis TaxID=2527868 RepID=A0A4R4D573_9PROT|nr:tetratricopeptide repeat protein [Roseicella aquatilis]TCZ52971.1 tetratricopeptide repeat protein [Roseicella aquatilis]
MRRLLALLLLLLPPAALAQAPAQPRPGPAARAAEVRKAELDRAFEALRAAPDEAGAALVEARIRNLWAQAASPSVTLLLRRGAREVEAQMPGEALEDFDAAITLQPDHADAWYLRAQAYARAGNGAAAARDLQEALRLEPRHWPALVSLARLQDEAGNPQGALRSLEAALAINPRMPGGAERLKEQRRKAEGDAT